VATAAGFRTVEAWLRSLRPSDLTLQILDVILGFLSTLTPGGEQRAAADLFHAFAFGPANKVRWGAEDWGQIHLSLLQRTGDKLFTCAQEQDEPLTYSLRRLTEGAPR
jgi:hypothetical protein